MRTFSTDLTICIVSQLPFSPRRCYYFHSPSSEHIFLLYKHTDIVGKCYQGEVFRMTQNPQYQNLRDLVFHAAGNYPSTRFFITDDPGFPHITGAELKTACGKFGAWMEQQYGIGRHIALLGPNGASWLTITVIRRMWISFCLMRPAAARQR